MSAVVQLPASLHEQSKVTRVRTIRQPFLITELYTTHSKQQQHTQTTRETKNSPDVKLNWKKEPVGVHSIELFLSNSILFLIIPSKTYKKFKKQT